jgi:hypothetical protein
MRLLLVVAAVAGAACPPFVTRLQAPPRDTLAVRAPHNLPATAAECIALAQRLGVEGARRADLRRALRALERAEALEGGTPDLWVAQARVVFLIAEPIAKEAQVLRWLNRGQQLAKRIARAAPERVEGHYYHAAFLGFRAQIQEVGGLDLLPSIVESGRRAVEIDPLFDDAAPLMMMGMVLVHAPAWPHGIGDPEEGLELLRRGVEATAYPLNRLILGKALMIDGQTALGCAQVAKVLTAPKAGRWATTGTRHRQEARVLFSTSRCSSFGRAP